MTTVTDSRRSFTVAFLAIPSIVGYARKTAEAHLVQWQLSTPVVDDSLIVVSELVTNGVRAKLGEDVRLTLTLLECHVLIEVWDCVPDLPEPKQPASLGNGEQDDPRWTGALHGRRRAQRLLGRPPRRCRARKDGLRPCAPRATCGAGQHRPIPDPSGSAVARPEAPTTTP